MPDLLNNDNKTTLLFKKFQNKTQSTIDVYLSSGIDTYLTIHKIS